MPPSSPRQGPSLTIFPPAPVTWAAGERPASVVCLGGRVLADALEALGHDVRVGNADDPGAPLTMPDDAGDAVVVAPRLPPDLTELARVLRRDGRLAVISHARDHRIPWVRRLDRILGGTGDADTEATAAATALTEHEDFTDVEEEEFRFWQHVDTVNLVEVLDALPEVRRLGQEERQRVLDEAQELYDEYGRGHDGMQLPWIARCVRARCVTRPAAVSPPTAGEGPVNGPVDGGDADVLMVDFDE